MAKMTDHELRVLVSARQQEATAASTSEKLSQDRSRALAYYHGDMSDDLPTLPGRSSAVSLDVSDTIEGMMPSLMEIFTGSDEVVKFNPVGPDDEAAAEQETDYVNNVFMEKNDGFLALYSFVKDALLSKTGIVKVWWEKETESNCEQYYGKSDDEFALLVADPKIEIVAHTENPPDPGDPFSERTHDVEIEVKKDVSKCKVMAVPPEEFGIEKGARTLRRSNYCYHTVVHNTENDLIEQGYDREQVKRLPSYRSTDNTESTQRDTQTDSGIGMTGSEVGDSGGRLVKVTEHYVKMDYERKGRQSIWRVLTGATGELMILNGEIDVVDIGVMPFAAMTPVILTHRFYGRSVADLVMDVQRIKTALLRALLDNTALANNPRVEVAESHAGPNTLDDLLVSRPGNIVRTKQPGGVQWQMVPSIGNHVYPLMEYQDSVKEWRTGVTRQGQGIDANALQNQSATAVAQAFSASQARIRLIARIFAETGIKDMFWLIHSTIKRHAQKPDTVKIRKQWVTVDPRNWKKRDDLTITVGLGTGGRAQRLAELSILGSAQEKMLAGGFSNIVSQENLYHAAVELTKAIGLSSPDPFFTNPEGTEPPQQQDPKIVQLQMKNEIEKTQAQADIATQRDKAAADLQLAERRAALEEYGKLLDMQMRQKEHAMRMAELAARSATTRKKKVKGGDGGDDAEYEEGPDFGPLLMTMMDKLEEKLNQPKKIVYDEQGRPSHTEPVR